MPQDQPGKVLVIDNLLSAFIAGIAVSSESKRTIYEVKDIPWRQVNFENLYSILLANGPTETSPELRRVPHPFISDDVGRLKRSRLQRKFVREFRRDFDYSSINELTASRISSILLSAPSRIERQILEEGLYTLIEVSGFHASPSRLRRSFSSRLRELTFPFGVQAASSYWLLGQGVPLEGVNWVDFRDFRSQEFELAVRKFRSVSLLAENVTLVLLKSPHRQDGLHEGEFGSIEKPYVEFNFDLITRFHDRFGSSWSKYFLKSHPSGGRSLGRWNELVERLQGLSIDADLLENWVDSNEAVSIPAEAFLSLRFFDNLLANDISTTCWSVCHDPLLSVFQARRPLEAFYHEHEPHNVHLLSDSEKVANLFECRFNYFD